MRHYTQHIKREDVGFVEVKTEKVIATPKSNDVPME